MCDSNFELVGSILERMILRATLPLGRSSRWERRIGDSGFFAVVVFLPRPPLAAPART